MTSTRRGKVEVVRLRWTPADREREVSIMWTSTQNTIESTDVILSSSHAKKLALLWTRISSLDGIKS